MEQWEKRVVGSKTIKTKKKKKKMELSPYDPEHDPQILVKQEDGVHRFQSHRVDKPIDYVFPEEKEN